MFELQQTNDAFYETTFAKENIYSNQWLTTKPYVTMSVSKASSSIIALLSVGFYSEQHCILFIESTKLSNVPSCDKVDKNYVIIKNYCEQL